MNGISCIKNKKPEQPYNDKHNAKKIKETAHKIMLVMYPVEMQQEKK